MRKFFTGLKTNKSFHKYWIHVLLSTIGMGLFFVLPLFPQDHQWIYRTFIAGTFGLTYGAALFFWLNEIEITKEMVAVNHFHGKIEKTLKEIEKIAEGTVQSIRVEKNTKIVN